MKKIPAFMLLVVMSLIFFGCPNDPDALMGEHWELVEMFQDEEAVEIPEKVKISAEFADGKISGLGVCNRYFAEYSIDKKTISISDVGSTKMGCMEYANLETNYFTLLQKAERFSMKKEILKIECENGVLKYVKAEKPTEEKK
ncbi:MAG: META domain-containing protein [Bacteroidota bacterium]